MMSAILARIRAWIGPIVADDPNPEYSRLDKLDGLGYDERSNSTEKGIDT